MKKVLAIAAVAFGTVVALGHVARVDAGMGVYPLVGRVERLGDFVVRHNARRKIAACS